MKKLQLNSKPLRILLVFIVLILAAAPSLKVVFAESDVASLFTSWFDRQTDDAIAQVDGAINEEKAIQMERLKSEIQAEIMRADGELDSFTGAQISESIANLRAYANSLASSISIENEDERQAIATQINEIFTNAMKQLDQIQTVGEQAPIEVPAVEQDTNREETNGDSTSPADESDNTGDSEQTTPAQEESAATEEVDEP